MTVVVGIDSSLTVSGCARVDLGVGAGGQLEALRWETWRARSVDDGGTVLGMRRRIRVMLREILAFVPDFVDLTVIEGPSMNAKHAALADERSGLRWMLIDQLLGRGPVAVVPPATRELLAVGHGFPRGTKTNARKAAVLDAARAAAPGAHVPDHNVADAVALAMAGAHQLGMPMRLNEKQATAHAKVAWPAESVAA